ncbi:MAG: flavin reductase family protein [Mariniblastus sp.]|nr:flavin reductase family protein [Mariniblastus sp.]
MLVDPEEVDPSEVYRMMVQVITPRPIAWVSTCSQAGVTNLAPYSYFNGICSKPAALMFSAVNKPDGSLKDTVVNIRETGQFVVNAVPFQLAQPMVKTAAPLNYDESEFDCSGMTEIPSQRVGPPSVAESPIQMECELLDSLSVGDGPFAATVVIGKILLICIDDLLLDQAGTIDPSQFDVIGRLGGKDYCRTTKRFEIP